MKNRMKKGKKVKRLFCVFLAAMLLAGVWPNGCWIQAASYNGEFTAENVLQDSIKFDSLLHAMTKTDREYLIDTAIYTQSFGITEKQVRKISDLAKKICVDAKTDTDKITSIYQWMTENLYYDDYVTDGRKRADQSPYTVIETNLAVCDGYAVLFDFFARSVGIPCLYLAGFGINRKTQTWETKPGIENLLEAGLHTWNVAYVDGDWRYYDVTWDCGNVYQGGKWIAGETSQVYFGVTAEKMAKEHVPFCVGCTARGSLYVEGTRYAFDGLFSMEALVIQELPEDTGSSYRMPASVSGYPVSGFDPYTIMDCVAWKQIQTLTFEKGRTDISDYCCMGMPSLQKVTVPEGVTGIGPAAFSDCISLKKVTLPSTLTVIHENAFLNCTALKSLSLPEGLKKMEAYAFSAAGLTELTLPSTLENLGKYAFYDCRMLKKLEFSSSLKNVPVGAAKNCIKLETVTLPTFASYIGKEAFYQCSSLKNVEVPDQVETIYGNAFANCYSLKKVTLGKSVSTLATTSFHNAEKMELLVCLGEKAPTVKKNFYVSENIKIQVPKGSKADYERAFFVSSYVKKYKIIIQE